MKKTVVIAIVLIVLGLALIFGSLASQRFDLRNFSTERFELKTQDVNGDFKSITIRGKECDVSLVLAKDGRCQVEATDSDDFITEVGVVDDALVIIRSDRRAWYETGLWFGALEPSYITVYLPEEYYEGELNVLTVSGDIEIPPELTFGRVKLQSTSGDVTLMGVGMHGISVKTTSGDIFLYNAKSGPVDVSTTSGQMSLESMDVDGLTVKSTSGDMELNNVISGGEMLLETVSGNVRLKEADGETVTIKTVSGGVSGTLLSPKVFETHTTSGDVDVPRSDSSGGLCTVKTTSGSIRLDIAQ